jgi:predicted transcriptional regulator
MPAKTPSLGDVEIQILRLVWQEQPCTERQVWELVSQQRAVARTTVLKTMQRLEAKGMLNRVPASEPVQYRAAVDEGRLLPRIVRRFVERTLAGSVEPLVAFMADSSRLSAKDVAALRAIARKMKDSKQKRN